MGCPWNNLPRHRNPDTPAAADLPTALCQLEILADKIHDTQRKIKLALAATRRAARKKEIIQ